MPGRRIGAFGLPRGVEEAYRRVLPASGGTVAEVAELLLVDPDGLPDELALLLELDIVRIQRDLVHVATPDQAVARYLGAQAHSMGQTAENLARLAQLVPEVLGARGAGHGDARSDGSEGIDVEVVGDGDVVALLMGWIRETSGQLCFLRPDQWRLPSESTMARAVGDALTRGRRVRAIYPVRALQEAPEVLRSRAQAGEQIRLVPELPTRLAVVGASRALLPEPLGMGTDRRLVVRHHSVVELLTLYFDQLWDSAAAVPALDRGEARPDLRRLLLLELARGSKDEQAARRLGVSLRTVRRRVAALMVELGVDTRFQAGVEAVRRGWI